MQMRIIRGKVKSGMWAEYEAAYKAVISQVGTVPGLAARWLARDEAEPDWGYSVSVWESEQALSDYESSSRLKDVITPALQRFFAGEYSTSHCTVVHSEFTGFNKTGIA